MCADLHPQLRRPYPGNRLNVLATSIKERLATSAAFSLASAFLARGATAGLIFLLVALAAQELDVQSFGLFSIFYSVAGMLALIAAGGQQTLIMRSWNEYTAVGDAAHFKGALIFGGVVFFVGLPVLSFGLFSTLAYWYPWPVAFAVTSYMAGLALVTTTSHLVRAAVGIEAGDGLGNLLTLIIPITYLLVHLFIPGQADLAELFFLFPLGSLIASAMHIYLLRNRISEEFPAFRTVIPSFDLGVWGSRSIKLWLFNGLEATNQFLDVLALGLLLSPAAAGAYFILTRLSNVFVIAHGAVQFYCSRHVPRLYFAKDLAQLDYYLRTVAVACGLLVPAGLLVIWIMGPYVLAMFGSEYVQYAPLLLLLSLGTAAILSAGASGIILTFTGHEGWIAAIIAATVATRLVGFVVVVPILQIAGAALVTASSFILMSAGLWHFTRKLTKLDGSMFRLLSPPKIRAPLP